LRTHLAVHKRTWKRPDGSKGSCWHFHKTINGVRYRDRIPTARTKAQAEEAERQIVAEIHAGTYGKPQGKIKMKEFVETHYRLWARGNKRSWKNDESRVKPILEFFGNRMLCEITSSLVLEFRGWLQDIPTTHDRWRSPASVNRALQLLSRIFSRSIKVKKWHRNPCSKAEMGDQRLLLRGERQRRRWLKPNERERLTAALEAYRKSDDARKNPHLDKIILLDLHSGLRKTELLKLRLEDCDFEAGLIRVRETKTDEPREVAMNTTARLILSELVTAARCDGFPYLFTNPRTGQRYTDVKKAFKRLLRDSGIDDLWFHDIRHSFATAAGDSPDVSLAALAETLGHKSIKTTMIYTHATDEGKRRVVDAAERFAKGRSQIGHMTTEEKKWQASQPAVSH
jgi:integrase